MNTTAIKTDDKFINAILEKLEEVNPSEWENFTKNFKLQFPRNAITKKHYKGFNILCLLMWDIMPKQRFIYDFMTFNQITKRSGKLKKGSKGIPIEFFSIVIRNKTTRQKITVEQYSGMSDEERRNYDRYFNRKQYFVFNIADIENLAELDLTPIENEEESADFEENTTAEELLQNLINNKGLKLEYHAGGAAYYSPMFDKITLPERQFFISTEKFYCTLFHEVVHWTGHQNRLNRDLENDFGSSAYSFEELIAELGSMLINFEIGILDEFVNSVRYLKGWLKHTKREETQAEQLRGALTESKKAVKFIKE